MDYNNYGVDRGHGNDQSGYSNSGRQSLDGYGVRRQGSGTLYQEGYRDQGQGSIGHQGQDGYVDLGNDGSGHVQSGATYGGQVQRSHGKVSGYDGGYGNQSQGGHQDHGQDFEHVAQRAQHYGGTDDTSYYSQAMNHLAEHYHQGQYSSPQIDENDLFSVHRQAHDQQGLPQPVSDPRIAGQAGAMEALKQYGSSGAGGQSPSDFVGLAMSQVSKFMGGNASPNDRQTAITQAAKTAFQLYLKTQGGHAGSSAGGGAGGLVGLLSGSGGGGGLGGLMSLASKFL